MKPGEMEYWKNGILEKIRKEKMDGWVECALPIIPAFHSSDIPGQW